MQESKSSTNRHRSNEDEQPSKDVKGENELEYLAGGFEEGWTKNECVCEASIWGGAFEGAWSFKSIC